jgi:hypothetical protein
VDPGRHEEIFNTSKSFSLKTKEGKRYNKLFLKFQAHLEVRQRPKGMTSLLLLHLIFQKEIKQWLQFYDIAY